MASIEERRNKNGTVSYKVKVRRKGSPHQIKSFTRRTDAVKWARAKETEYDQKRNFKSSEASKHTLGELIDRYIADVLVRKPKSIYTQKTQLLWWKKALGCYLLSDISSSLVAGCRDKLAKTISRRGIQVSAGTVNRYMAALSHAFTIAIKEWEWMEDSPISRVSKLKEPRGRVRFLSDDERERLLQACKESPSKTLHLIVILALSTGARKMEISGLRWDSINFERQTIILHETKNGERRVLPLAGHALALMNEYAQENLDKSQLVFPSKNGLQPIDIRTPWETAVQKAGLQDFRFHDLRHSAASYLAMSGASLAEIAEVLGHKTLSMVKRYSHLSESHTAGVVTRMNNKIFG